MAALVYSSKRIRVLRSLHIHDQIQYRNSFFHAYDKQRVRRKSPGSVFKPLTWKPRWRMQAGLFILCCGFPWIIAFHHAKVPGHDAIVEKMVTYLWHFEDKDNINTFERLPPVKTIYDRTLEANKEQYDRDMENTKRVPHLSPIDFAEEIEGGLPTVQGLQSDRDLDAQKVQSIQVAS